MQYTVPAQYAPYMAYVVERAIREVTLDADFRSDGDPRIQRFASVPDEMIDREAAGVAVVQLAPAPDAPRESVEER